MFYSCNVLFLECQWKYYEKPTLINYKIILMYIIMKMILIIFHNIELGFI